MAGIGATNMENRGIDYRERSPLVVPPKLDLPPPASTSAEVNVRTGRRTPTSAPQKGDRGPQERQAQGYLPNRNTTQTSELNVARTAPGTSGGTRDSGAAGRRQRRSDEPVAAWFHRRLHEHVPRQHRRATPFQEEPPRELLTQPPVGYQTPSPNYAYGTGPKKSLFKGFDPYNQQSHEHGE